MEKLHTRKFIISFLLIMALVVVMICKFLSWHEIRISEIDISDMQGIKSEDGFMLCLDSNCYSQSEFSDTKLNIRGWTVIKGQPTNAVAIFVLLKDNITGKVYKLPTTVEQRTDVTAYINSQDGIDVNDASAINYDYSGFWANTTCADYFDFVNNSYEMGIMYTLNGAKYVYFSGVNILLEEGDS